MAGKTAVLAVKIITDGKAAGQGLDDYNAKLGNLQKGLDSIAPVALVALYAIERLTESAATAASNLEQSSGAVEAVFTTHAAQVEKLAQQAAQNVGLAESEYGQLAAVLGAQLSNMGVSQDALAGQTDALINKGADLAAQFGGSTADAVNALSSLLRGERDPIERYGVSIKQADIDARKAALGLQGLTGDADRAADTQATLAILLDQTASSAGRFALEADTAAGSQQRANAEWENAQANLGEALIPLWVQAALVLQDLSHWIGDNSDLVLVLVVAIGLLAAGVLAANAALRIYEFVQLAATVAQWAFNVALTANPIGLIIVAIGLLIGIIVLLVTHWDEVSAAAADFWDGIVSGIQAAIEWIQEAVDWFARLFTAAGSLAADAFGFGGSLSVSHGWDGGDADDPLGASGPWPTWPTSLGSSGSSAATVTNHYEITVNGAMNTIGTAREIKKVLTEAGQWQGDIDAAGVAL